jgi:predicted Zn-dependent protease
MRRSRRRLVAWLAAIASLNALTTACVVDRLTAVPAALEDARGLAADADAEERALLIRVDVYEDADLDAYLTSIVDRLLSEDERSSDARPITVTVLRDPSLNAFAMPSGHIFLHTGLLARVENEAQLATILARELAHVSLGHGTHHHPRATRTVDAIAAIARTIGVATASPPGSDDAASDVLSPVFRAIVSQSLAFAYAAAVDGYGATLARAADAGAVERLTGASYDRKEAPHALERLRRAARAGGALERFFYGSDKALAESADAIARLVAKADAVPAVGPGTASSEERLAAILLPVVRDNVKLDVSAGRFRLAQEQLDRVLALAPEDARVHLMAGELYRLRAQRARSVADRDELARKALTSYQRCLELDPDVAEVQRGLGLLYYYFRQPERAREAFARYVALRPDAPDVARVREYLAEPGP